MKHRHEWLPLMREPRDGAESFSYNCGMYGAYYRCMCGKIGRLIRSNRGGIRILNSLGQKIWTERAADWNARKV